MLLLNSTVMSLSPPSIEPSDLRVQDGKISGREKSLRPLRGEEVVDLRGRIVLPGLVCAHTHLYSALARGMAGPKRSPQNFLDILQFVWWKLDRALDEETIYYSALVGGIDAARCGTTTIVDHHASPRAIAGSLDIIKEALAEVGIRAVLCYEVTDRGGIKERNQGLRENERFVRANMKNSYFRGLIGAHASFTLSSKSLRLCGELAGEYTTGVHIHAAEDRADVSDARENFSCGIVDRLDSAGCLRSTSILAHGVHLSPGEIRHVERSKSWLVHNPRSNMNNAVGYAPVHRFGQRSALGTDGFMADMFDESKSGFFKMKDAGTGDFDIVKTLSGGQQMISEIFNQRFGALEKGSAADLVVLDYLPPTPLKADNLGGHFLFGMQSSNVDSVMAGGKWIVRNRSVTTVDTPALFEKAQKAAKRLWKKMESID